VINTEVLNYLTKVKALTVKDLQAVGKKYLTEKNRMVFTLMPEVETPKNRCSKSSCFCECNGSTSD
jgi:zinc protease